MHYKRYCSTRSQPMVATMRWLLASCLLSQAATAQDAAITHPQRTADAYTQPFASLSDATALSTFQAGRTLFRQVWTIPGGEDSRFSGLGPLYNRFSCLACHPGNGRGFAPDGPHQSMKTMLVRLSVPDRLTGQAPHPFYGDQLNEFGIPGVNGEGAASIRYQLHSIRLADGESVQLRQPVLQFSQLAYGEIGAEVMTSARIAPAMIGMGLLDLVPDAEIMKQSQRRKPEGISGRPNLVWDIAQQKMVIGKFGWKANVSSLRQQIASAFSGDLGITSSLFAQPNCGKAQTTCLSAATPLAVELTDPQLDAVQFYLSALALPQPVALDPAIQRGAALFKKALCMECHVQQLNTVGMVNTSASAEQQALEALLHGRYIEAYTDILLHDMGEALADHRPDFAANGREWRTAPLWGVGLAKIVHPQAGFLHDGRARTIQEAILWHDGEADTSRVIFSNMSREERALLIRFVESL